MCILFPWYPIILILIFGYETIGLTRDIINEPGTKTKATNQRQGLTKADQLQAWK